MKTSQLFDQFGRPLEYLRIAVTDRCNLRCFYCMPAEGMDFVARNKLLSYEEIIRLIRIYVSMGVKKVRFTGGEPFIRKNFYGFLKRVTKIPELEKISITTNGAVANRHLPFLKEIGIDSLNLSLDTLDPIKYKSITRRDFYEEAMSTYYSALDVGLKLNVNMVVMADKNKDDIIPMAMLTKNDPVSIRFIEEMPFNGTGYRKTSSYLDHTQILGILRANLPKMQPLKRAAGTTANRYSIEGHKGNVGIIAAWSRTFCGDCNRIRITATGELRNCLYDNGILNLKHIISDGSSDQMIIEAIKKGYRKKKKDGFIAEKHREKALSESMSAIGG